MSTQDQNETSTPPIRTPVFPFYLDTEMLTGFIATLEDGFSLSSDVAQQSGGSTSNQNRLAGEAGVGGGFLQSLFRLNISGGIDSNTSQDDREEYKFILQHTEASLFNRCRETMNDSGISTTLGVNTVAPAIGNIVEISGVLHRNPLYDLLDMISQLGLDSPTQATGQRSRGHQRPNQGRDNKSSFEDPAEIFRILKESMTKSTLIDFVLSTKSLTVPNVVLTLRRSVDIDAALDLSVGGVCSVLGKVTNTYSPEETIHLYRRTILKMMPQETVELMFKQVANQPDFNFDASKITITGGAIQILPLAIYI